MRFNVKAMRAGEGITALALEAANETDATRQAEAQGYTVLGRGCAHRFGLVRACARPFPFSVVQPRIAGVAGRRLAAGGGGRDLGGKGTSPGSEARDHSDHRASVEGKTLSQALEYFPQSFPALYVATVRAAERTGDLQEALQRYIAYQTQLDTVKKKLVSASIYPVLLVGVGGLVTLFLMGYVVPKFSHIFEDIGGDIPLLSRLLIKWGVFMEANAPQIGIVVLALLAALVYLARLPETRRWVGQKLWSIPAIGERMRVYQLARFYRTVGMLLNGGIPVVTALEMVEGLLHTTLRGLLRRAALDIREGKPMSQAMEANHLTTPVSLRMLRVGERTGRMGEMMERVAAFYDEEMARWVDWFTRLFEPILMALIGVIIGGIVVLMYMPIFELAGSIQ